MGVRMPSSFMLPGSRRGPWPGLRRPLWTCGGPASSLDGSQCECGSRRGLTTFGGSRGRRRCGQAIGSVPARRSMRIRAALWRWEVLILRPPSALLRTGPSDRGSVTGRAISAQEMPFDGLRTGCPVHGSGMCPFGIAQDRIWIRKWPSESRDCGRFLFRDARRVRPVSVMDSGCPAPDSRLGYEMGREVLGIRVQVNDPSCRLFGRLSVGTGWCAEGVVQGLVDLGD